ncbi:hypothetical protein B0H11DRAFT_1911822 [Mycena galericulata]|nr:hypothetical protein B0H11DRAFT_1911822 [Mycena galericulata]
MSRFGGTVSHNTQCVAGIPDAIESDRLKYSTASVKNEELPSSWIRAKASRRKSEETVSFRIALAITSNSNRRKSCVARLPSPRNLWGNVGLGCSSGTRLSDGKPSYFNPRRILETEMLIAEEELGDALRVLLIQPPEDIEALNRIYTYIANVVVTAAEPGDNWGDEQDTALVDQLFEEFCFPQT